MSYRRRAKVIFLYGSAFIWGVRSGITYKKGSLIGEAGFCIGEGGVCVGAARNSLYIWVTWSGSLACLPRGWPEGKHAGLFDKGIVPDGMKNSIFMVWKPLQKIWYVFPLKKVKCIIMTILCDFFACITLVVNALKKVGVPWQASWIRIETT